MNHPILISTGLGFLFWILTAVCTHSEPAATPIQLIDETAPVENPVPTWETQKHARTYQLAIPGPRGQITDRYGKPLAQTRISHNLAISFPTPLEFTDKQALDFALQQITLAKGLLKRDIRVDQDAILTHYKNRGVLPLDIAEDLSAEEIAIVQRGLTPNLILRQTYLRLYPQNELAAHVIGYTGREAPLSVRHIENGDLIFPESEGREGLEQIFNEQLVGQKGTLNLTFDADGNRTSERIAVQPVPGYNVITTLDQDLQRLCEKVLRENAKRGAIVILDPNNGEILAMASWPVFNPNVFIPYIRPDVFQALNDDPSVPLYPRAFRSAYPPGSTFKAFVGLAALASGAVTPTDKFNCPTSYTVGNHTFMNWKKTGAGMLNFREALIQSCNTWFYQVGIKTGSKPIIEWSNRLGLGMRTGIPLKAEEKGNIPTDDYMLRVHKRKIKPGDVANMSIGQGDILITPLQMAQAMGILAAGGRFHQTRLVKQIQTMDNKVIAAYPDRIRDVLPIPPGILSEIHKAMVGVTQAAHGTAHTAKVKGIEVAGKTGTAQWGPKTRQRTAAWFAGFAPADEPKYAFAAVYEGDPNDHSVHGGSHAAPLIGKILREIYSSKGSSKKSNQDKEPEPEEAPPEPDQSN